MELNEAFCIFYDFDEIFLMFLSIKKFIRWFKTLKCFLLYDFVFKKFTQVSLSTHMFRWSIMKHKTVLLFNQKLCSIKFYSSGENSLKGCH